jgi:hypothetical protein
MRSQDKYKQLREEATLSQMTDENGEANNGRISAKNEELKTKLNLLNKNIKRAQKKEAALL